MGAKWVDGSLGRGDHERCPACDIRGYRNGYKDEAFKGKRMEIGSTRVVICTKSP